MGIDWDLLGSEGISFFGRVGESACREMRRMLTALSGQEGRLRGMIRMIDQGMTLDSEQIRSLAYSISDEIRRAENLVEKLDHFSKTVSEPVKMTNICEAVETVVAIFRWNAGEKGVLLNTEGTSVPAFAATNQYFIKNLIHLCLEWALSGADKESSITITVGKVKNGARIVIAGTLGKCIGDFPCGKAQALAKALMCELATETEKGTITLNLPDKASLLRELSKSDKTV